MAKFFDRDGAEFGRGLGFFDAIYGFAITLLVANIDLPPAEAWRDPSHLLDTGLGTQVLGFLISFVVIAVFWWSNTDLLSRFRGVDGAVTVANLVIACLIVFLPFTTQGISDPTTTEYPLATALYAVNVALAIAAQSAMHEIGRARGLVDEDLPRGAWWAARVDVLAKIGILLLSIPVAYLVGPSWGQLSWLLLFPVGVLTGRWSDRVSRRAAEVPAG
ncbi:MAG: TMEM175 family protein [Leucobacter sp.]